ncbi:MAG: hypothetical protein BHW64_02960 [Candidatus Melainabacteria bacterium LEY3_CP_29_8]|nr:MAG: hypothetical protein BHW64_02960 [Candidatus Melainabacteria bacterium LEY3_CP_29_8]
MQLVDLEKESINKFNELQNKIEGFVELTSQQANFLVYLLKQYNPKKILELGVSAGGSSLLILDTIKEFEEAHLYSIDYLDYWYKDKNKSVGFLVEEKAPELLDKWTLKTGGLACEFMEQICPNNAEDIDFCFIDTMHLRPGEILDFLMVLPYLKKNTVVVFHDTCLHYSTFPRNTNADVNCLLMSAIKGQKFQPKGDDIPNIGAIVLDENIKENLFDVFNLLILKWYYMLTKEDYDKIIKSFEKHYDEYYVNLFKTGFHYNEKLFEKNESPKTKVITNKDIRKMYKYMLLSKLGIKKYKQKLDKCRQKSLIKI